VPPPLPDFFAAYRVRAPAARDDAALQTLIQAFEVAVDADAPPPADFPRFEDAIDAMRTAARARLAPEWLAFLEYAAASWAVSKGDLAAIQSAAHHLADLERRCPDLAYHADRRALALAELHRVLGDYAAAFAIVDRLQPRIADADALLQSALAGLRGDLLRETGRLEEAAAAVREAVDAAWRSGDPRAIERAQLRDCELALATGRYVDSIRALDERLAALPAADRATRAMLLACRGYAESGLATDPAALAAALATLDRARPDSTGHLRVRVGLKRLDLALRAAAAAQQGAADADAARAALAVAAQAFADCAASLGEAARSAAPSRDVAEFVGAGTQLLLLRRAGIEELRAWQPRQRDALRQLAAEWRDQAAHRGGIGFLHLRQRRDLVGEGLALELALAEAEGRADGPVRAVQILLDLQGCTSLARARGVPACRTADVQELLRDRHGALVYLPARRTTWAILIERDRVACHALPGDLQATEAIGQLVSRVSRPAPRADGDRAKAIARLDAVCRRACELLLPGEVGARVASLDALTVVGADLLGGVPFEALLLPDGRLLGEAVALDATASLPLVVAIARHAKPVARRDAAALVLCCTDPDAGVAAANGIDAFACPDDAVHGLAAAYGRAVVPGHARVTRQDVLDSRAGAFPIVHLVAHRTVERDGLGSGLVVRDGVILRHDLDVLSARGLVVVSTCGAGDGPGRVGEGDGFASLAGAFLWHGAQAVIASRNDLQALDHLRLMSRCHAQLARGASPARAMQLARSVRPPDTDLLHRVQWALVQVFGAGQVPVIGP
jgi:hypothetical protein